MDSLIDKSSTPSKMTPLSQNLISTQSNRIPMLHRESLKVESKIEVGSTSPTMLLQETVHFHQDPLKFYQQSLLGLPSHFYTDCLLCMQAMTALTSHTMLAPPFQTFATSRTFSRPFYQQRHQVNPPSRMGHSIAAHRFSPYSESTVSTREASDDQFDRLGLPG